MKNIREEIFRWVHVCVSIAIWLGIVAITHHSLKIDWESVTEVPHALVVYGILSVAF
jgi:hypothetical protein